MRLHLPLWMVWQGQPEKEVKIGDTALEPPTSFSTITKTGVYSLPSRCSRIMSLPTRPHQGKVKIAAYLAETDISPQHLVHSWPWQRGCDAGIQRKVSLSPGSPEVSSLQEKECFIFISWVTKRKKHSKEQYPNIDCLILKQLSTQRSEVQGVCLNSRDMKRVLSEAVKSDTTVHIHTHSLFSLFQE